MGVGMRYPVTTKIVFALLILAGLLMGAFAVLGIFNILR